MLNVCVCVCVCSRDSSSRGERVTEGAALHGLRLQLHDAPPTDLEKHLGVSVTTQQPILPWQRPTSTATGLQPPHTDTQARGGWAAAHDFKHVFLNVNLYRLINSSVLNHLIQGFPKCGLSWWKTNNEIIWSIINHQNVNNSNYINNKLF